MIKKAQKDRTLVDLNTGVILQKLYEDEIEDVSAAVDKFAHLDPNMVTTLYYMERRNDTLKFQE